MRRLAFVLAFLPAYALGGGCVDHGAAEHAFELPDHEAQTVCPVQTWEQAYLVWEEARCVLTERCFPDEFAYTFPEGVGQCVDVQMRRDCNSQSAAWCATGYADRCPLLGQCVEDMTTLECESETAPQSCYEAMR